MTKDMDKNLSLIPKMEQRKRLRRGGVYIDAPPKLNLTTTDTNDDIDNEQTQIHSPQKRRINSILQQTSNNTNPFSPSPPPIDQTYSPLPCFLDNKLTPPKKQTKTRKQTSEKHKMRFAYFFRVWLCLASFFFRK